MAPTPTEKKAKFRRSTEEQLNFYVEFCRQHPEMLNGKKKPRYPAVVQDRWRELAERLNSMRGPTRTALKWKENLAVWKCQLRGRARQKKPSQRLTRGCPYQALTEFEERALGTFANAVDGTPSGSASQQVEETQGVEKVECGNSPSFPAGATSKPASPTAVSPAPGSPQRPRPTSTVSMSQEVMDLLLRSIERRDEREEQAVRAQLATAAALETLSSAVVKLAKTIDNLNPS